MPGTIQVVAQQHAAIPVDAAVQHPYTFLFMALLALVAGIVRISGETGIAVRPSSLVNAWTLIYLFVLMFLMSVSTGMALVLLVDPAGQPRVGFIPASLIPISAAVFGVLGFEVLFRKFVIGFGENQLDLGAFLQGLVDQAVAATIKKEVD